MPLPQTLPGFHSHYLVCLPPIRDFTHAILTRYTKGPKIIDGVDNFSVVALISNIGDVPLKLYKDPRSALSPFPVRAPQFKLRFLC